jgi:hypothetical protein
MASALNLEIFNGCAESFAFVSDIQLGDLFFVKSKMDKNN